MDSEMWTALFALTSLGLLVALWRMHRRYRKDLRKLEFLFNAAENLDFSFRFPQKGQGRAFNLALNRIKDFLESTHRQLSERERYYEQILSVVSTAIMVSDAEGRVLLSNQAAQTLLGREFITHISQVQPQLQAGRFSVRQRDIRLHGNLLKLWAISDIAHELDLQEMASWEKLIRVLTHEIMNGVTPVTSLCQELLCQSEHPEALSTDTLRQGLHTIHDTSDHLRQFVENYRSLTLLPKPAPAAFYVKPFLEGLLPVASTFGQGIRVETRLSVEPSDLMLYADEPLLARVITNLLKNAVEAMQQTGQTEGCISLVADMDQAENVRIAVSNNGAPIPPDVAANIFVPFFTTKSGGSGIGLSLSARIMQACGGRITLQESVDGRTTFLLTFEG